MRLHDERGQITVFLALAFLVLLGLAFCVLEGVHGYMESSLAEEAITETGIELLANYDRYLFKKYHVLFLDPRERECMPEDAQDFLDSYFSSGFYDFRCMDLAFTDEKTAVDEKGLFLRYQINEYMKYKQQVEAGKVLMQLLQDAKGWSQDIEAGNRDFNTDEGGDPPPKEDGEKEEEISAETQKYRMSWTKVKGTLEGILRSGVLVYAADHPERLSSSAISKDGLPSVNRGGSEGSGGQVSLPDFSFNKLSEWRGFLNSDNFELPALANNIMDTRLPQYMTDCFSFYGGEESEDETALKYELEYIAGGKASDIDNLKYVVNRILLIRFITNYTYASRNATIQAEAEAMAVALTGYLGMPQAAKAVKVLLVAALSYGESLLELHALLDGEKVALAKDSSSWNLSFIDFPVKLATKASINSVKVGISYKDYLMLMCLKNSETTILYRMMDIMQLNTCLHEPGFRMEDCLFSFKWSVRLACSRWFTGNSGTGSGRGKNFELETQRFVSY